MAKKKKKTTAKPMSSEAVVKEAESEVPALEEIVEKSGFSIETAKKIRAAEIAMVREKAFRDFAKAAKNGAHYICRAKNAHGYYRIGRHFDTSENLVFVDELTAEQVVEIEQTEPALMSVTKVGFPEEEKQPEPEPEPSPGPSAPTTPPEGSTGG